jgi:WD40 repeat protein
MAVARGWHTATLLQDGRVLVIGGRTADAGSPLSVQDFRSAELYNPATATFTSTGSPARPLSQHTATLLPNGKVLIAGGVDATNPNLTTATATAEIYDPATGAFSPTGNMTAARTGHTATLLANGRVLITGGSGLSTAEVYDPATSSFSATGIMGLARASHTATLLSNGTVLVAGGGDSTAELYDPAAGSFIPTGGMESGRTAHSATLLQNGEILVAGGGSRFPLATAELYK